MSPIHVETSRIINARPDAVYAVIADYRVGHPAILPKQYFRELVVEQGGVGAGTIIRFRMEVMGVEQIYHAEISEPIPGRVLVETDESAGVTTTFTVEPVGDGSRSRVTFATEMRPSAGVRGLIERLVNPPVMRRIYREEQENLARYVGQGDAGRA